MDSAISEIRRLKALPCWRGPGPIRVEPLSGGITNRNYRVTDGSSEFVARCLTDRSVLGINRRNEVLCQRIAHARGVAPEIHYDGSDVLISRFVPGRVVTPAQIREPAMIGQLGGLLRTLHHRSGQSCREVAAFSSFGTVRDYASTANRLGAALPTDIDGLLADVSTLESKLDSCEPALCHNDLLANNILADEPRLWLVDWEYAGMGRPLFDLAGLSSNHAFSDAQDHTLLEAYRGAVHPRELHELRVLKAMSLLREALWAVIQTVASEIAFDYKQYAEANFQAYRDARRQLN